MKSHYRAALVSIVAILSITSGGCLKRERASSPPPDDQCAVKLKLIGTSILIYRQEHQGSFPPDLGTLAVGGGTQTEEFFAPSTKFTLPEYAMPGREMTAEQSQQLSAWFTANSDFAYVRPASNAPLPNLAVCYEKGDFHGGDGTDILYADGNVRRVPAPQAKQEIDTARNVAAK